VFCPRCGAQVDQGSQYCSACGATISGGQDPREKQARSPRALISGLLGKTRRARILTLATLLALVVAVIAFIALPSGDDEIPQDAYTQQTGRICVEQKRRVIAVRSVALRQPGTVGLAAYAAALVPVLAEWREEMAKRPPPPDRRPEVEELDQALRDATLKSGTLARLSREGERKEILAAAAELDGATESVEDSIQGLALEDCSAIRIGSE
jgi:hypothetical protein